LIDGAFHVVDEVEPTATNPWMRVTRADKATPLFEVRASEVSPVTLAELRKRQVRLAAESVVLAAAISRRVRVGLEVE
jgi:hypothetical protein